MKLDRMKKLSWLMLALPVCMLLTLLSGSMAAKAASANTKKLSGVTYKITSAKKKTAAVSASSKSVKNVKIAATVKVKGKTYKVTEISKNAFKNRTKLKNVTIGKNIKTISSNAFYGCRTLSSVTISATSLTKIGTNAFKGIKANAKFSVPNAKYKQYQKLIQNKKTGWKKTMKVQAKGGSSQKPSDNPPPAPKPDDSSPAMAEKYEYSITPLTEDICSYFYVKTENPDPESFDFIDENTEFTESGVGGIRFCKTKFADVEYINPDTLRVNGGYIFYGTTTDGGTLTLEAIVDGKSQVTKKSVTIPKLYTRETYLTDACTTSSMSFFEKMDAIQLELVSFALYGGVVVNGELHRNSSRPYYGLMNSPHKDLNFFIESPYYLSDNKPLLMSELCPYKLDSYSFPRMMGTVALMLDDSVTVRMNSEIHYQIDVIYQDEKRIYGETGKGGNGAVPESSLQYKYCFDDSPADAFSKRSWKDLVRIVRGLLGKGKASEEEKEEISKLTWEDIINTVGTDGGYARIRVKPSSVFNPSIFYGFTFLYSDDGLFSYMSDVWYDGRFFNAWEYFQKGMLFEDQPDADIVIKDAVIPFPKNGEGKEYLYQGTPIEEISSYDPKTGIWSGFTKFSYDEYSGTWIASVYDDTICRDENTKEYLAIEGDFADACILTLDEVKNMSVDRNTNSDPETFYRYDSIVPPGTKATPSELK